MSKWRVFINILQQLIMSKHATVDLDVERQICSSYIYINNKPLLPFDRKSGFMHNEMWLVEHCCTIGDKGFVLSNKWQE